MKYWLPLSVIFIAACSGGDSGSSSGPTTPAPTADTTAPVITLNGAGSVVIVAGEVYQDAGATATDNVDGEMGSQIVVTGNVDNNLPGEYKLLFNVSDQAGNSATTMERLITVQPNPVIQVDIQTHGVAIVDEPKIMASMLMTDKDEILYQGNIGIEYRGSTSQTFDKKSYGFETWDQHGEDMKVELAGFPEEEDWIFYGPYSDKSLLRNVLIFDLSNQMGRYAVRTQFVEVTVNDDYNGLYVLMEKIKRDSERVDISKLKSDDISGGYILKIDKTTGEDFSLDFSFSSQFDGFGDANGSQKIKFLYEYPKPKDIEPAEKAYIQDYMADFEQALMSDDFTDPDLGYRQYIDVDSFIDFFILNELTRNVDAFRLSTFMHKDKGEKLNMGPIWDFNIAFGNADYCQGESTVDWAYKFNQYCPDDPSRVPFWWGKLLQDPQFVAQLKARWSGLRTDILSEQNIAKVIQAKVTRLKQGGVIKANFERYNVLGVHVWPNFYVGANYDEEVTYLKQWISDRLNWMDSGIQAL
ncbi:CotH kinase family protein [uncultured Paraglaciecola sp.]|uniref:CotH kinase family protein n=1 Tax=uncultured Paraglaciecola sp. TaxID=1765024 RepID=UPI00260B3C16|nr:CotH kinase family protein [uncultured Paraglaciecola sp.]